MKWFQSFRIQLLYNIQARTSASDTDLLYSLFIFYIFSQTVEGSQP